MEHRVLIGLSGFTMTTALLMSCAGNSDVQSRAQTVPEQSSNPSVAAAPGPTTLTRKKARAALLTVQDLPTGWSEAEADKASPDTAATYAPRSCSKMGGSEKDRVTLAKVSFSESGALGARLTEEIYRPKGVTPKARLKTLRDAMTECRSYSVKDATGTTKLKLSALSFPTIADGTLAVHSTVTTPAITATDDVIYIAVGSVIVRFDSISLTSGIPGAELERLARLAATKVRHGR
jgi:hypothetical protein